MRKPYALFGTLAIGLFPLTASAAHLQAHLLFSAKMDGAQQVPAVATTALGLGGLTLNPTRDTLCVNIGWTGLSSAITGLHIHDGVAGTNGPVLVDLVPFIAGDRVMTILTGATLTPEFIAKHLRGELYLNLHTANNPDGEIRGQVILPETDHAFVATLDGVQQVPVVSTEAVGLGTFLLARHRGTLTFNAVVTDLSGPIVSAHFHTGAPGTDGPVVLDLASNINGTSISGEVDPTPFLADLMAGNIYLNVHTDLNPDGEIRGQLYMPQGIAFDAMLDGAQQVPPEITDAKGAASLVATWDMDSIWYDVLVDGLSSTITDAHLHNAPVGSNGPVALDMSDGINGNRVSGWITDPTQAQLKRMLEGNLYVNLHTTLNQTGEVRGQLYRYMRQGYSIAMDGAQQVPTVNTSASGTGAVSVDRGQSNAHIMWVTNADAVVAAHLHVGLPGVNGPVQFDMSDLIADNSVFTYWKSTDATPFTLANSLQFRNDSLYLNVHTTPFPDGEVRGQVRSGAACTASDVGIVEGAEPSGKLVLWPVPVAEQLTFRLPAGIHGPITVQLIDALGAVVSTRALIARDNITVLDVSALTSGLYFARLSTGTQDYTARFMKQ